MTPSPSDKLEGLDGAPRLEAAADAVREPPSVPHPASMVEEVARAIYDSANKSAGHSGDWDKVPEPFRSNILGHARSAISALREPTPEMIEAGRLRNLDQGCLAYGEPYLSASEAEVVFSAMIDEALK